MVNLQGEEQSQSSFISYSITLCPKWCMHAMQGDGAMFD